MSVIGPGLPPHLLAKRKRQQEADEDTADTFPDNSKQDVEEKRRRVSGAGFESEIQTRTAEPSIGPVRPPLKGSIESRSDTSGTIGPTMPSASLHERPQRPIVSQDDSSDDDDDLGPALSSAVGVSNDGDIDDSVLREAESTSAKLRRDDWMTMAPSQDDLAARMDPTRLRARGFNTGKSARGGGRDSPIAWNETAEEKQKRLANEVLGISSSPKTASARQDREKARRDDKTVERVRETAASRGPSLLEKHNHGKPDIDDDPSKRAFDREKDMGNASRITGSQKREMIAKATDYSSRFSKGSYL